MSKTATQKRSAGYAGRPLIEREVPVRPGWTPAPPVHPLGRADAEWLGRHLRRDGDYVVEGRLHDFIMRLPPRLIARQRGESAKLVIYLPNVGQFNLTITAGPRPAVIYAFVTDISKERERPPRVADAATGRVGHLMHRYEFDEPARVLAARYG